MPKGDKQARIHELARSLKDLHLAGSMEEALKRAKDMVSGEDEGKSIRQLMDEAQGKVSEEAKGEERGIEHSRTELEKDSKKEHQAIDKDSKSARRDDREAKKIHSTLDLTGKLHKLEHGDTKDALHEVDDIDCAIEDTEAIVKQAEKVQKKAKK